MLVAAITVIPIGWIPHLLNLLWRAWLHLLSALGTTTLAVIVALLVLVLPVVITLLTERKTNTWDWKGIAKKSFKPTNPSAAVPIVIWLALYGWAVATTIYDDHTKLVQERDHYIKEVETLRAAALRPDPVAQRIAIKDRLGALQRKADTVPPNDEEKAKAWGTETRDFIRTAFGDGEADLFLSDAGFVFYGGGEDSRVRNWMIGRLRRLGNLIERADTIAIRADFKP